MKVAVTPIAIRHSKMGIDSGESAMRTRTKEPSVEEQILSLVESAQEPVSIRQIEDHIRDSSSPEAAASVPRVLRGLLERGMLSLTGDWSFRRKLKRQAGTVD